MPIPPAVVLDPDVAVSWYRGSDKAIAFLEDVRLSGCEIYALEGLHYDVLDGLVEDAAWGESMEPALAAVLGQSVLDVLAEMSQRGILRLLTREPFLLDAFKMAMSTKIGLARCLAATVGIEHALPLVVTSTLNRDDLVQALGSPDQLSVLCLEELY